ncbi:hypothetical protein HYW54_05460 [Candidatus Gottesmanbacteria bacterium]|nr:hypothetical protein [Candidatus Gottesmanbacteria bacterium]
MKYLQTAIVTGGSKETREEKIKEIISTLNIAPIDILKTGEEKSIGIEEIRKLLPQLYLAPVAGNNKICIFYNFDKATIEAQNALLKTFEEPPKSVFLIAEVFNIDSIPSTIVSRAQIIKTHYSLPTTHYPLLTPEKLFELFVGSEGHKINFVSENIKNRDEALLFIDSGIEILRTELLNSSMNSPRTVPHSGTGTRVKINKDAKYIITCLQKFQKARIFIDHNVNPKLSLEILLFSIRGQTLNSLKV